MISSNIQMSTLTGFQVILLKSDWPQGIIVINHAIRTLCTKHRTHTFKIITYTKPPFVNCQKKPCECKYLQK